MATSQQAQGAGPQPFELRRRLLDASSKGVAACAVALPTAELLQIARAAKAVLLKEKTLLEIDPRGLDCVVVGDLHGQYQDLNHMLDLVGPPSSDRLFLFNGDFVDRGAWGLEVLVTLLAYKTALPNHVYLIRGNHESTYCVTAYGFMNEVKAKYPQDFKAIFAAFKDVFAALPLAAVVASTALVLHGGLFRAPPPKNLKGEARKMFEIDMDAAGQPQQMGRLEDLRNSTKGGKDPDGVRAGSKLQADVLWSDPCTQQQGMVFNTQRGVGTVFGADVVEAFLAQEGLKLIIRAHEGPDARRQRDYMPSMDGGYSVDITCPSGRLVTVFSAPDYPQHLPADEERVSNKGAVAVLQAASGYCEPDFRTYGAVHPRPQAECYYELVTWTGSDSSDEEGSGREGSEAGDAAGPDADEGAAGDQQAADSSAAAAHPPHAASLQSPATRVHAAAPGAATAAEAPPSCSDTGGASAHEGGAAHAAAAAPDPAAHPACGGSPSKRKAEEQAAGQGSPKKQQHAKH